MNKKSREIAKWVLVFGFVGALVFLGVGLGKAIEKSGIQSSEAAGWVQATGAIIGILIAIAVPTWQHRTAESQREEESRFENWRVLRLIAMLVGNARDEAEGIGRTRSREDFVESPEMRQKQIDALNDILQALEEIPLVAIATTEAITYVMKAKKLLREALKEVKKCPNPTTAEMQCGALYGQPWIRFYSEFREAEQLLSWHARQYRAGVREPCMLNDNSDF